MQKRAPPKYEGRTGWREVNLIKGPQNVSIAHELLLCKADRMHHGVIWPPTQNFPCIKFEN